MESPLKSLESPQRRKRSSPWRHRKKQLVPQEQGSAKPPELVPLDFTESTSRCFEDVATIAEHSSRRENVDLRRKKSTVRCCDSIDRKRFFSSIRMTAQLALSVAPRPRIETTVALLLSMYTRSRTPFLLAVGFIFFRGFFYYLFVWFSFFACQPEFCRARQGARSFLRRIVKEGERTVQGQYSRQLAAAYVLSVCKHPKENIVFKLWRFKMKMINQQAMDQLQSWNESRMGYRSRPRYDTNHMSE